MIQRKLSAMKRLRFSTRPALHTAARHRIVGVIACLGILGGAGLLSSPAHAEPDADAFPGHTTVLTCEPLTMGMGGVVHIMDRSLQGFASAPGRREVAVPTTTDLSYAGLMRGRDILNSYITRTPGKKVVFGYSRGAQIASEWLRTYADKAGAPAASELSFVFIGNPQRRLGGKPHMKTAEGIELLPTPDDTQYQVTDISKRWDGWSNADNWPVGPTRAADMARLSTQGRFVDHSAYDTTWIGDHRQRVRAVKGNTTYLVAP